MSRKKTAWRPQQVVRPVSIGVVWRDDCLLASAVCDDNGQIEGWRPLGGSIEFGEPAAQALKREFMEELSAEIDAPVLINVIENFYDHYSMQGHEIMFVFEARFLNRDVYERDRFEYTDGNVACVAEWVPISQFRRGALSLYPERLLALLDAQ